MRSLWLGLGAIISVLAVGIGCSSIVKKPEINGVKKVAIVSLYADEVIPWTGGAGRVENFNVETKNRVALQAYKAFVAEFKRLNWQPLEIDKIVSNEYYKKEFGPQHATKDSNVLARAVNAMGAISNERFFTATGLFPISWPSKEDAQGSAKLDLSNFKIEAKKDFYSQMADLGKNLGVDALILVHMDYCYTGSTAVLGNGTAKFTAGSTVRAINPDKQVIVDMTPLEKRCDGDRGESNKTVAMVGGSIALGKTFANDAIVTGLTEASKRSAKLTVSKIREAIQKN